MGEQRRGWLDRLLGRQQPTPSQGGQARGPSQHERPPDSPAAFGQRKPSPSSPVAGGLTEWRPGQHILEEYDVERTLGQGGMGTVYLLCRFSSQQRFAVKRMRVHDETHRRNFLSELQTWIDLPDHPHLVPCRFFRTLGEEIAIFAEYIEGGSLKDWIDEGRLYAGGPQQVLARILDIAIQFAWGLHSAHEQGLVHQDVKPGNLLLTPEGMAKVADFGLARAKAAAGEQIGTDGGSLLVSCGGMTKAYASPEQVAGARLSRTTDTWSFAVSLLHLFTGEVTWYSGVAAPQALAGYLHTAQDSALPVMPRLLVTLLQHCFQRDPAHRPSLLDVAEQLRTLYRASTGQDYPRPTPPFPKAADRLKIAHDRRIGGVQWTDPRDWLLRALKADGRDPAEVERLLLPRTGSRQAQAVADLAAYEEARRIYERLVAAGRGELEPTLATLCGEEALVHQDAGDPPGALARSDQAIAIYNQLIKEGRTELRNDLAIAYTNKAAALHAFGNPKASLPLCDQAIAICEQLVTEGHTEVRNELAGIYRNKATVLHSLGEFREALPLYDQAIAIREQLIKEGHAELRNELARTYQNKAAALKTLGEAKASLPLSDQAIAIYNQLIKEGHTEVRNDLASTYNNKANALKYLGNPKASLPLYDQAIAIYEQLVKEGHTELRNDLARTYNNKANALTDLGNPKASLPLYDQAIAIYQELVEKGYAEFRGYLAWVQLMRAHALLAIGDRAKASTEARGAIRVLEAEVRRTGRADLQSVLEWARRVFKEVL